MNLNYKHFSAIAVLIFCGTTYAVDVVLLQAGKTFVKGVDEAKAKSIADNREEIKKYSFDELKIKAGDSVE